MEVVACGHMRILSKLVIMKKGDIEEQETGIWEVWIGSNYSSMLSLQGLGWYGSKVIGYGVVWNPPGDRGC